tara:strand:- start:1842 stop:2267 length:426 start_codon:yes stop_codon:yes gene_type:complete
VNASFDLVPIKVKNGFVVGRVYVRMIRAGIRTYYNIYDFKAKKNVMLNVCYKNSAIAIAETHNTKSPLIHKLIEMEEDYSHNYMEMTYFKFLYNKTADQNKKQIYETRFDNYQSKCIDLRQIIDNCIMINDLYCAKIIYEN